MNLLSVIAAMRDAGADADTILRAVEGIALAQEQATERRRERDRERKRTISGGIQRKARNPEESAESGGDDGTPPSPLSPPAPPLSPLTPHSAPVGADAAASEPTPAEIVWGPSLRDLAGMANCSTSDARLRSMVGKWCKTYGESRVIEVIEIAAARDPPPIDPVAFVTATLQGSSNGQHRGVSGKPGHQSALDKHFAAYADAARGH